MHIYMYKYTYIYIYMHRLLITHSPVSSECVCSRVPGVNIDRLWVDAR